MDTHNSKHNNVLSHSRLSSQKQHNMTCASTKAALLSPVSEKSQVNGGVSLTYRERNNAEIMARVLGRQADQETRLERRKQSAENGGKH